MDPVPVPTPVGDDGIAIPAHAVNDTVADLAIARDLTPPPPGPFRQPGHPLFQAGLKTRAADALARHNPFYLLSAMSMLGACLLLANSLSWSPIPFGRLLSLLGILNLYELLLLSLGLYLARKHKCPRDAGQLLFLAAVFLSDAAFLNSEVVTFNLAVGVGLNALLFSLAIAKVLIVARALRLPLDPGRLASITLIFALLFGLPVWLKTCDRAAITGLHLFACWWAAAIAFAAYDLLTGRAAGAAGGLSSASDHRPWGLLTSLFVAVPFVSLLTHVAILHYVYNESFVAPDAAPVLLLLAVLLGRIPSPIAVRLGIRSAREARLLQAALPLVAVFVSTFAERKMNFTLPLIGSVSPLALTLAAAIGVYAQTLFRQHAGLVLGVASVAGIAQVASPPAAVWSGILAAIGRNISRGASALTDIAIAVIPATRTGWGVTALTLAFLLLAIGARFSLRRPPPTEAP